VNFQITVLKILVSYPDGFALMADFKRDMAILATSGCDWGGADQAPRRSRARSRHLLARLGRATERRMAHH
jgi:hypothetical protein